MTEKEKNQQVAKIAVFITSIFVIVLSVSFAFTSRFLEGSKRQVITVGNPKIDLLLADESKAITLNNAMPVYDEVGMLGESYDFTVTNYEDVSANYVLSLIDITEDKENELDYHHVKYGLTINGNTTIKLLSDMKDNNLIEGTIEANEVLKCSLRLWLDIDAPSSTANKSIKFRVNLYGSPEGDVIDKDNITTFETVADIAFKKSRLGNNCRIYNDGVDTFLVGQCQNNYVWYSGKLWRVVLKNNRTGTVKMVTDNAITVIIYNKKNMGNFENSYVDQWLNQEFLQTLHDYQDYLVEDSAWDVTLNDSDTPSRPVVTTTIQRTVGLLNAYEYYTTYNNSEGLATVSTGYLNTNKYWWLMTPNSSTAVRYVTPTGELSFRDSSWGYGIRPSANLKKSIGIVSGEGTKNDPYRLKGDVVEKTDETILLNTKYSGEYISFNNELYRIVDIEEGLTKIVAVVKPEKLRINAFHNATGSISFDESDLKKDLEKYYQELSVNFRNMIEPNMKWYVGEVDSQNSFDYKHTICASPSIDLSTKNCIKTTKFVLANIGLPRIGEMFTSQVGRKLGSFFWTVTPCTVYNTRSLVISYDDYIPDRTSYAQTDEFGARPSMYLKSNVVIAKNNTGDGTYEHPYDIELAGS